MARSKKIEHPFVPVPRSRLCGHTSARFEWAGGIPMFLSHVACAAPKWKHSEAGDSDR